jgi:hypothetical protein
MRKRNITHFLTKPKGRLENTDTNMTFSMPRGTAARLKEVALAENKSPQQILAIALAEWLARRSDAFEATAAPASLGA